MYTFKQRAAVLSTLLAMLALGGCATGGSKVPEEDSLESVNRAIYSFNSGVDKYFLKPLAQGYRFVTPDPVERGLSNMFSNLGYPSVIVNQLLQGKPLSALQDTGRFVVNSTIGLAGFVDVADRFGWSANNEDFDQTLAVWGVPSGPYVVLPFLGPSTLRGALSTFPDQALNVRTYIQDSSIQDKLIVLEIIALRASILPLDAQIAASNDPYIFVREGYLQNRNFNYYDGDPPAEDDFDLDDEDFDDLEDF
ncbi:MAG: VacJ family lipoprotein [Pseudomonadota bacterium]